MCSSLFQFSFPTTIGVVPVSSFSDFLSFLFQASRRVYTCHTKLALLPQHSLFCTSTGSRTQAQGTASPTPPLLHRPFYCCAVTRITHRSCAFFTPSAWFTALHCSLASPSRPFKFGCLHACARHSSAVPRTCMSSFSSSFTSSLNQRLHQGTSCSVTIFEAAHTAGPRSLITTLQLSQSSAWA